ncbi:MAG: L-threonine 3-dehydrogenase [Microbacteriaceae bacterium]|nr:L-threonine 3-dehydrogenase [Microbacteriaceae bacterium]
MRALIKERAAAGLTLTERPEPEPGPGEAKVRVLRTGICGTDLHIDSWDHWAQGAIHPPLVPGHEFSGVVVELGDGVESVRVGDLVSAEGHVVCGMCRNCRAGRRHMCIRTSSIGVDRDGAFAEYVAVPAGNLWVHPEGMDPDLAAIFDPLGNAVHTALTFPLVGEDVLVTGAGPIGLMAARIAQHVGARHVMVTDVNPQRLALAESMGVFALNVAEHRIADAWDELGLSEGFDIGLEISGQPSALSEMLTNMNHGGKIALLGLPSDEFAIDWSKVVTHMITIQGIYGRQMFETWYLMTAMLGSGLDVSPVITDRFPADRWDEAFATARAGSGGKVLIEWAEPEGKGA